MITFWFDFSRLNLVKGKIRIKIATRLVSFWHRFQLFEHLSDIGIIRYPAVWPESNKHALKDQHFIYLGNLKKKCNLSILYSLLCNNSTRLKNFVLTETKFFIFYLNNYSANFLQSTF